MRILSFTPNHRIKANKYFAATVSVNLLQFANHWHSYFHKTLAKCENLRTYLFICLYLFHEYVRLSTWLPT